VLVNRVVENLTRLASTVEEIHILRGNHDGLDANWPYFGFLNKIPNIHFHAQPEELDHGILALPHARDPIEEWKDIDLSVYEIILLHGTVQGAKSETGFDLKGIPASLFANCKGVVLAGDVHVPQVLNGVYYVGSPYLVRFGDKFAPRVWSVNPDGDFSDIHFETTKRVTFDLAASDDYTDLDFVEGDQYKIRVTLSRAQATDWHKIKQAIADRCKAAGAELTSIELLRQADTGKHVTLAQVKADAPDADVFARYCAQKRIAQDLIDLGQNILKDTI
jgi:hypothetical protein